MAAAQACAVMVLCITGVLLCRYFTVHVKREAAISLSCGFVQMLIVGVVLALLPPEARAKVNSVLGEKGIGIDLNQITAENIDAIIEALSDMTANIDADGGQANIRVFCE